MPSVEPLKIFSSLAHSSFAWSDERKIVVSLLVQFLKILFSPLWDFCVTAVVTSNSSMLKSTHESSMVLC